MIRYNEKNTWKEQIEEDIKELTNYKASYNEKNKLYSFYLMIADIFKNGNIEYNKNDNLNKQEINEKIKVFNEQIQKIDTNLNTLSKIIEKWNSSYEIDLEEYIISEYNQEYKEITKNYINNCLYEDETTINYLEGIITNFTNMFEKSKLEDSKKIERILNEKNNVNTVGQNKNKVQHNEIENNDTLVISEITNKVLLPYTAKEVTEILYNNPNKYETEKDVINEIFTRDFSDYHVQFISRYRETIKLAKEREGYGISDSILLATEMMRKRMLHPAIISACKTINELDVYLDCLDKNELDDFKIFKIKYEVYPIEVKKGRNNDLFEGQKTSKSSKKGTRYKENTNISLWNKFKNIFNINRSENKDIKRIVL